MIKQKIGFWFIRVGLRLIRGLGLTQWHALKPHRLAPPNYRFERSIEESGRASWRWVSPCGLREGGSSDCADAIRQAWKDSAEVRS